MTRLEQRKIFVEGMVKDKARCSFVFGNSHCIRQSKEVVLHKNNYEYYCKKHKEWVEEHEVQKEATCNCVSNKYHVCL